MTFYTISNPAEDNITAQAMTDAADAAMTEIEGDFPTTWTAVSDAFVDDITSATGALIGTTPVTPFTKTGGSSSGFGPLATGLCVTWLTNTFIGGRRVKGRTFVSPTASEFVDTDGTPKSSLVSSGNTFATAWITGQASGTDPVVWHRPVGGSGGSAQVITAASVKDRFAVLKSRRD